MTTTSDVPRLGLIAGNGRFPFLVAAAARRQGRAVIALAIREEASEDLAAEVDELHWVGLGELSRAVTLLKRARVTEAVMAGQVKHRQLFSGLVPDLRLLGILARLATKNTDSLLGAVADVLAQEGIRLLSSIALLQDQLASAGAMTGKRPSREQHRDIAYGRKIALAIAGMDLGQTVVVKSQAAVALEAMEGTDEAIRRAGRIAGPGVTVIKVAKPRQDPRFDVPVVGPSTLDALEEVRAGALAVDAAKTLMVDKAAFLERARSLGIVVWGMEGGSDEP